VSNPQSPAQTFPFRQELAPELTLGLLHKINNLLTRVHFQMEGCKDQLDASHPAAALINDLGENIEAIRSLLERTSHVNLPQSQDEESCIYDLEAALAQQMDLIRLMIPKVPAEFTSLLPEPIQVPLREADLEMLTLHAARALRSFPLPKGARIAVELRHASELPLGAPDDYIALLLRCVPEGAPHAPTFTATTPPPWMDRAREAAAAFGATLALLETPPEGAPVVTLLLPRLHLGQS